jgi:gamma-glutamyltranspeptidase / glutathione hydrolase
VCGALPPLDRVRSAAAILRRLAVLQILGMVERFPLAALGPDSAEAMHLLMEAHRLAFADRERYVGDPDFVAVPVEGLLDAITSRARALIDPQRAHGRRAARPPAGRAAGPNWPPPRTRSGGTSHLTIADAEGNVVALTSSIEAPFGSRMISGGFLLNNQLTDFSFRTVRRRARTRMPWRRASARAARCRRSSCSMSRAKCVLAIGARGGPRIIAYVLKALVGVLDWELDIQDAIALPNFAYAGDRLELERGTALAARREEFRVARPPRAGGRTRQRPARHRT